MEKQEIRKTLRIIIFGTDTKAGKLFDIILLITIAFSVVVVMLNSVNELHDDYGSMFIIVEWVITILFTFEYILRIYTSERPLKYIFSFYGIIDLLSIIPTYISIFVTGTHFLLVIRMLRLMRIFRVLKLGRYINASNTLLIAFSNSRRKILVFLEVVLIIVVITGSMMYLVEGPENGFTSIPKSIYWAIVTITTVGYGDIAPNTILGQTIASILMITGFAIIAVPTSIVGSELVKASGRKKNLTCKECKKNQHDADALFCDNCGSSL
ncbi:MAG: ion transporter [Bacteroidetes bacterium]|nr:ion transporter [Bacteroidota bacterium]